IPGELRPAVDRHEQYAGTAAGEYLSDDLPSEPGQAGVRSSLRRSHRRIDSRPRGKTAAERLNALKREFEAEGAAFTEDAVEAHPAAVAFDDIFDEVQPQACAFDVGSFGIAGAEEGLKEACLFFRADTVACVADFENGTFPISNQFNRD